MKKIILYSTSAALLLSSCGTYTGEGAYTGATLGSVIGSAIGGISDGRRGHDMGTLIGMAGGAIIGGAVGAMADERDRQERHEHYERIQKQKEELRQQTQKRQEFIKQQQSQPDIIIDETNSGDDRIEDFTLDTPSEEAIPVKDLVPKVEIRHAQFIDESGDNSLSRNETGKLTFEVYNMGEAPLYGLEPMVIESTGNKYIHISPSIIVEKIRPRRGVRYTATIKADNRAKAGTACLQAIVRLNGQNIVQPVEFTINTSKR